MVRGKNVTILVGNLGSDPEFRAGDGQKKAVATLSVATTESWKDKQTGEREERTDWHRVKCFGKLAEIAHAYAEKGQLVWVQGKSQTDRYTDKAGVERYSTEVVADELEILSPRKGKAESDEPHKVNAPAQPQANESARRAHKGK